MTNKKEIKAKYEAKVERTEELLKAIADSMNKTPENVNYGHIGDQSYINEKLEEILLFMKG